MYVIKSNRKTNSYTVRKINRVTQVVRVGRRGLPGDPATNLVQSVNGKQGAVVLNATDVGAEPTGSASQALSDAKDYTDSEVSTLDSSLATVAKTGSYDDLSSKPTIPSIAGLATEAQVQDVQDNLDAHTGNTSNPHNVTKAQVGLGNVSNLAPADMPVSTAQQVALDGKVNKAGDTMTGRLASTATTVGFSHTRGGSTLNFGTSNSGRFLVFNQGNAQTIFSAYADGKTITVGDETIGTRITTGTGFPNGVVSAPVGSTYIDTAATNGAIEWKKATGTGNTGWVVSVGDTGWTDISSWGTDGVVSGTPLRAGSEPTTGVAGAVSIMRENGLVRWRLRGITFTANLIGFSIPAGFRIGTAYSRYPVTVGSVNAYAEVGTNSVFLGVNGQSISGTYGLDISYTSRSAWPATLPTA